MSILDGLNLVEVELPECVLCGNPVKQIGFDAGDLFVCRDCFDGPTDDELDAAAVDAEWGV